MMNFFLAQKNWLVPALTASVMVAGCSSGNHAAKEAEERLIAEVPPYLTVEGSEVNSVPVGKERGTYKVTLKVRPKEALFRTHNEGPSIYKLIADVDLKLRDGSLDQSSYNAVEDLLRTSMMKKCIAPVATPEDSAVVYGSVTSIRIGNEWKLEDPVIADSSILRSQPRSAFPPDAIIAGSEQEAQFINDLKREIEEIRVAGQEKLKTIKVAEETKIEEQNAKQEERRKAFMDGIKAGTIYRGVAIGVNASELIELKILECNKDPFTVKARLTNPEDNSVYRNFTGVFNFEGVDDPQKPALMLNGERAEPGTQKKSTPFENLYIYPQAGMKLFYTSEGFSGESFGYYNSQIKLQRVP